MITSPRYEEERPANHSVQNMINSIQNNEESDPQVRIRKKRIRSTRGDIRRFCQIQNDRFSGHLRTPDQRFSIKKKLRHQSSPFAHLNNNDHRSTKAGDSSIKSVMYKSYAPTSLVKVGTRSVRRLCPSLPYRSDHNQTLEPPIAPNIAVYD